MVINRRYLHHLILLISMGLCLALIGGVPATAGEKEARVAAACAAKAGMAASACVAAPAACGAAYVACVSAGLTLEEIATCASNPSDCFGPNNDLVKAFNILYPPKGQPWSPSEIAAENAKNEAKAKAENAKHEAVAKWNNAKHERERKCLAKSCWWKPNEGPVNQNYGPEGACRC